MSNSTIGIDVSKEHLDTHRLPDAAAKRFANDAAGHRALIRWIKAAPVDRIVFEATGPVHIARVFRQHRQLSLCYEGVEFFPSSNIPDA